jgi:triacylglycerol lipase
MGEDMKRTFLGTTAKLILVVSSALASVSSFAHDPVLMIPGMGGTPSDMQPMSSNLQSNGWPSSILFTWTDADQMNKDMEVSAQAISTKVDQILQQTGAQKVVLVTWSASTVAGRYYIKNLGGAAKVSQYVSFAGPHHGISIWQQCASTATGCRNQWGPNNPITPWLVNLNSGTEVPGSPTVKYLTLRSTGDFNATPYDTGILAGADENFLLSGAMAPSHFTIISDSTALSKLRSFIIANESTGGTTTTTTTLGGTTTTTTATTTTTTIAQTCYTSSNSAHVTAGRAHDTSGSAYANGSNNLMGIDNSFVTSKLRKTGANFYKLDSTCP